MKKATVRRRLDKTVHEAEDVEIIIVHYRDGSNDFFSSEPNATECQRPRIIHICEGIVKVLRDMGDPKRPRGPGKQSCPVAYSDAHHVTSSPGCPV